MTCQAYPGSGIIILLSMTYTYGVSQPTDYPYGEIQSLPLVPAPTGAGGFYFLRVRLSTDGHNFGIRTWSTAFA